MINIIKCFCQIYIAWINCRSSFHQIINCLIQDILQSLSFLKPNWKCEDWRISTDQTMFKNFRNYRTDCNTSKVHHSSIIAVIASFRNWKNSTKPTSFRHASNTDHNIEGLFNYNHQKYMANFKCSAPSTPAASPHSASIIISYIVLMYYVGRMLFAGFASI